MLAGNVRRHLYTKLRIGFALAFQTVWIFVAASLLLVCYCRNWQHEMHIIKLTGRWSEWDGYWVLWHSRSCYRHSVRVCVWETEWERERGSERVSVCVCSTVSTVTVTFPLRQAAELRFLTNTEPYGKPNKYTQTTKRVSWTRTICTQRNNKNKDTVFVLAKYFTPFATFLHWQQCNKRDKKNVVEKFRTFKIAAARSSCEYVRLTATALVIQFVETVCCLESTFFSRRKDGLHRVLRTGGRDFFSSTRNKHEFVAWRICLHFIRIFSNDRNFSEEYSEIF